MGIRPDDVSRRESVAAAVLGLVAGYAAMTAAVAAGLGLLVVGAPVVLNLLTVLGGSYLIWLGWRTWRSARVAQNEMAQATSGQRSTFVTGVCMSGLNPKALVVFVALLPQFVRPGAAWPVELQLAVLGLVFKALVGAFYPLLGALAAILVLTSAWLHLLLARTAGTVMIALGVVLLGELRFGSSLT